MKFDENLGTYVFETERIIFSWEEEPEGDYENEAKKFAKKYYEHLPQIIEFMLPDLKEVYGEVMIEEVKDKLGKAIIDILNGTVTYCEQTFDDMHIFSFEFLDDEFTTLQFFSIDG